MPTGKIRIGTSGWHYQHWQGPFYPTEMRSSQYLAHYCQYFQTVEINNTFYQLPEQDTLLEWTETVPAGFCFAVKASRYITHMKKLKDPQEALANFLERIRNLQPHLGPVLFQLPPHWHLDLERLQAFLKLLPADLRYAFEFRDPDWFAPQVYQTLRDHQAAFCIYVLTGDQSPREVTADFIYVRLHGPDGAYQGKYSLQELAGWAGALSSWSRQGKDVFCFFNNDAQGYAPQNASELHAMLAKD